MAGHGIESIGRYRIVRELAGEYTALYEAHDPAVGRTVHVATAARAKLSPEDYAGLLQGFRRRARVSTQLTHAGIVPAYEAGEMDGIAYLATEPATSDTLKSRMQDAVPWPTPEAIRIVSALLEVLDFAHRNGIVYRNVNPAGILLDADGAVRLADFSLAFFLRPADPSEQEEIGAMVGTMAYMSPEQIAGKAFDGRSDLFVAGIVLYMLLTGRHPFQRAGQWQMAKSILQDTPVKPSEVNPQLPAAFDAIVMRALAKDPDGRYPSGHDFAAALWAAHGGEVSGDAPAAVEPQRIDPDEAAIADNELTYKLWIRQIKDMEGGWLGFVVILITVIFTGIGGWFGLDLFPSGRYPQLILAIPGLVGGAFGFFVSSSLLWNIRRAK